MSDGTRTHDRLDHNQELYQLSYAHRGRLNLALPGTWIASHPRLERESEERPGPPSESTALVRLSTVLGSTPSGGFVRAVNGL